MANLELELDCEMNEPTASRPWVLEYQSLITGAWITRNTYRLKRHATLVAKGMEASGYITRITKGD